MKINRIKEGIHRLQLSIMKISVKTQSGVHSNDHTKNLTRLPSPTSNNNSLLYYTTYYIHAFLYQLSSIPSPPLSSPYLDAITQHHNIWSFHTKTIHISYSPQAISSCFEVNNKPELQPFRLINFANHCSLTKQINTAGANPS